MLDYNDAYYLDNDTDYPYCRHCYQQRCSGEYIHDYGFKPEPIFYGKAFATSEQSLKLTAEVILMRAPKKQQIQLILTKEKYIKYDGSLDDGMEIVTHPMTLDYTLLGQFVTKNGGAF